MRKIRNIKIKGNPFYMGIIRRYEKKQLQQLQEIKTNES